MKSSGKMLIKDMQKEKGTKKETFDFSTIVNYPISDNKESYTINIECTKKYIIFKTNDEDFNWYKTKLELLTAINYFKLPKNKFKVISQLMIFINNLFKKNKVSLQTKNKDFIILKFKTPKGEEEKEYFLNLKNVDLEIEEKFNYIINEINILKCTPNDDDKISALEFCFNEYKEANDEKILEIKNMIKSNENKLNEKLKEKQKIIDKLMEEINRIKNLLNIQTLPHQLKYKETIVETNDGCGPNDIFEVFSSITDNNVYLVSKNKDNYNLDIINLKNNEKIISLSGHNKNITSVRYFQNDSNEYLVSADYSRRVIIWDIKNNFEILHKINTNYDKGIWSCLLLFNVENENYIITSTDSTSDNDEKSATKLYSLEDGSFIKYIINTKSSSTNYILPWHNQKDEETYIVELCTNKIIINNVLKDETYAQLIMEPEDAHYGGFIYSKEENDYLFSSSCRGFVSIWDLYEKSLTGIINNFGCEIWQITPWSNRYIIGADFDSKSLKIMDIKGKKVVGAIKGQHTKGIVSVKKIVHPIYGESLISSGWDHKIIVWSF